MARQNKGIAVSLNTRAISKLQRELKVGKRVINRAVKSTLNELGEMGVEAIMENTPPQCSDLIANTTYTIEGNRLRFTQKGEGAIYVEFGTGFVGGTNPHPLASRYHWDYGTMWQIPFITYGPDYYAEEAILGHVENSGDAYLPWTTGMMGAHQMYNAYELVRDNWRVLVREKIEEELLKKGG